MASNPGNKEETSFDDINKELLKNQSFLYSENVKLQEDVTRLSMQLEALKTSSIDPQIFDALKREKDNLHALNHSLKNKIKNLKTPAAKLNATDIEKGNKEKEEILRTVKDLDKLIQSITESDRPSVQEPGSTITKTVSELTRKLSEVEKKYEEATQTIRKLREDDEKYVLRERINDMKQLITDLEVENTKLKFESEQLAEDVENYKRQMQEASDEAKEATKKCYQLEDEKDKLRDVISLLENEKIKLKKDMIEEMNEANRAKRVSVDTEIALQHLSEAFENKRKEVMALQGQLEDAEKIIRSFQRQLEITL